MKTRNLLITLTVAIALVTATISWATIAAKADREARNRAVIAAIQIRDQAASQATGSLSDPRIEKAFSRFYREWSEQIAAWEIPPTDPLATARTSVLEQIALIDPQMDALGAGWIEFQDNEKIQRDTQTFFRNLHADATHLVEAMKSVQ